MVTAGALARRTGRGRIKGLERLTKLAASLGQPEPEVDLPPASGGMGSESHAALSMVIPSMLALASKGVR